MTSPGCSIMIVTTITIINIMIIIIITVTNKNNHNNHNHNHNNNNDNDDDDNKFPAHDELGMCRTSLVCPEQFVLRISGMFHTTAHLLSVQSSLSCASLASSTQVPICRWMPRPWGCITTIKSYDDPWIWAPSRIISWQSLPHTSPPLMY